MKNNYLTQRTFVRSVLPVRVLYKCGLQRIKNKSWYCYSGRANITVDRGFEHRSSKIKAHKIDICCFSSKHAALMRKSKDWLVRNQNNVSEWDNKYFSELAQYKSN